MAPGAPERRTDQAGAGGAIAHAMPTPAGALHGARHDRPAGRRCASRARPCAVVARRAGGAAGRAARWRLAGTTGALARGMQRTRAHPGLARRDLVLPHGHGNPCGPGRPREAGRPRGPGSASPYPWCLGVPTSPAMASRRRRPTSARLGSQCRRQSATCSPMRTLSLHLRPEPVGEWIGLLSETQVDVRRRRHRDLTPLRRARRDRHLGPDPGAARAGVGLRFSASAN